MINKVSIDLDDYWCEYYAVMPLWTLEEAVSLAYGLNPQYPKKTLTWLEHKDSSNTHILMRILKRALEYKEIILKNNQLIQLDFIELCKLKNVSFFLKLEILVKNYNAKKEAFKARSKCLELENKELKKENEMLKKENTKLREEVQNKPNAKVLNTLAQIAMGNFELLYGEEQIKIWQDWSNKAGTNKLIQQHDLNFSKIQNDYASLNREGITVKRDAICDRIKEYIHLMKKVK